MHVIFRERHGLEESDTPTDLGQSPADLVVLSFSDSDLGAFAAGWRAGKERLPSLRLANLSALRHPLSVDTYIDATLAGARGILVRLIGGASYWDYGLTQLRELARSKGLALAVLPADGREDPALDATSTLPVEVLRRLTLLCDMGGGAAARAALTELALAAGLEACPEPLPAPIGDYGWYDPERGVITEPDPGAQPLAVVTFYRAYLTSGDTGPIDALIRALRERGFRAVGLFAPSLKASAAAAWISAQLATLRPAAIVNATAFSAKGEDGRSPLDAADCPVFQVALSTARRSDWASSERGLSPADLAMHVVLPEVDGRIFAGVVSFKSSGAPDPELQYALARHEADEERIAAVANRIVAWHRLATSAPADRRFALILSTYPGRPDQMAHAVGLDALASAEAIVGWLGAEASEARLADALVQDRLQWPITAYRAALDTLPEELRADLFAAWSAPETDPLVQDGQFHFPATRRGDTLIALQPERGEVTGREAEYHDLSRTPRHGYVAFYLWLRSQGLHALAHIGAHGTLEWLPGKAVALSHSCWPDALLGELPLIYPFIVNDPGEAAQAKRRTGAVTLGHLPPPLKQSAIPDGLLRLERLLDEYSTADGLDPARRDRLIDTIRTEAQAAGVERDLGLMPDASAAEAITRIDRFVCDIKESQFGDGLHIYGESAGEREGLMAALAGRRVEPGPSGSPQRARSDVLPTGRNLYAVDPRAVPSRAAHAQGVKLAEELLRRHLQDHGDYPRGLVIDLWGSATMRTAGEEFAMALHLAGVAPLWDNASERVTGFEVLPLALLDRPRIDVTLRVSGLFRDVFPGLAQLFNATTEALAARDEEPEDNPYLSGPYLSGPYLSGPYRTAGPRVFGPRPGQYGVGMGDAPEDYGASGRERAGEAWLTGSEWSLSADGSTQRDRAALEARLRGADSFVHVQDLPETDLLLAADYAAHEGGIAAAMAHIGAPAPALYHIDATRPDRPAARSLNEELARVMRARAANPDWASGMMRHGFRGAAEIATTLDNLAAFAQLTRDVPDHLFDLYFDATLGRDDLVAFMERANPAALAALKHRFHALAEAGLWRTRRNSIAAALEARA